MFEVVKVGLEANNCKFFEKELRAFMELVSPSEVAWFSNIFHALLRLVNYKVHVHKSERHVVKGVGRPPSKRLKPDIPLQASREEDFRPLNDDLSLNLTVDTPLHCAHANER
ncbi:hypothetical protein SUGI_0524310 [Cryptomeria japonica]|nr:hypothetical protein SUGI_0524310 [Cryptomeria japonica]